ncbi:MAG: DUF177 domain-containing protein [Nitrospinae bacterium]|nr:DUF177 domain-containing protein [Nitrospinota bacterium]
MTTATMKMRTLDRVIKVALIGDEGLEGSYALTPGELAGDLPVDGPVRVTARLYKVGEAVHVSGEADAPMAMECARCLKGFVLPVEEEYTAVYMKKEGFLDDGVAEDEVELSKEDMDIQFFDGDELDLWPPARDQLLLALPMRPLCDEACKGLCPECGQDLNEKTCGCETAPVDPRFAELKKLLGGG